MWDQCLPKNMNWQFGNFQSKECKPVKVFIFNSRENEREAQTTREQGSQPKMLRFIFVFPDPFTPKYCDLLPAWFQIEPKKRQVAATLCKKAPTWPRMAPIVLLCPCVISVVARSDSIFRRGDTFLRFSFC